MSESFTVSIPKSSAGRKVSPETIAAIKNLPLATITKVNGATTVSAPQVSSGPSAIRISYTQRASYTRAAKEAGEEIKFVVDPADPTRKSLYVFRVAKGTIKPRASKNSPQTVNS